ncbi:MAG: nucleoside monophosphate kinase [Candidatus Limnocylindrales bacterium]
MTTLQRLTASFPTVRPDVPVVVLFGCPGAGKGTLADILVSDHGFAHLSTGVAMRAWADGPLPDQVAVRAAMARGDYGSDDLAARIVRDTIGHLPSQTPAVILDGFPRNLAQYRVWRGSGGSDRGGRSVLGVLLDLDEDVAVARITCRGTCPIDGTPIAGASAPCPHCGTTAERRTDDCEVGSVRRRFAAYREMVLPILDAWGRDGLELIRFDAGGPIEGLTPFAAQVAGTIVH